MDTSAKYIEMCSKATEIQELDIKRDEQSFFSEEDTFEKGGVTVWLPRQDQLQEMYIKKVGPYSKSLKDRIMIDIKYHNDETYTIEHALFISKSFEQFWLQLTMIELYCKTWSNKQREWIKT